jgi:Tol biopolymer transport system component
MAERSDVAGQTSTENEAPEPVRLARTLRPGQRAELHVLDVDTGASELLLSSPDVLFEAPNWHPDGRWIVVNGDGVLHRIDVDAPSGLEEILASGLPELNNDHLISPDGQWHYLSANDGHLYRLPWQGGQAERATTPKAPERTFRHFLHGVSPDGRTLAYVGSENLDGDEWGRRALWLLDLDSGDEQLLGNGYSPADGPDFSPDGHSVYFNSEVASSVEGHAQLFRHDLRDGSVEQLTSDERVNWFPHPSPDGHRLVYLSYPPGTVGHPADLPVELRLIDLSGGSPDTLIALPGGQGTINVSSWAPDRRRLAYVSYPTGADS